MAASTSHPLLRQRRVFALLMTFLALASSLFLFSPKVVASTRVPHSPILISGNSEFIAANGVTGGTGTASDPYVIQGWNITVCWQCPYYGIEVANTTAYFRIFNVTVSSLITAQPATGILLKNATNGGIDNSVVQDQSIFCCGGVFFFSSKNINFNSNKKEGGRFKKFSFFRPHHTVWGYGGNKRNISCHSPPAHACVATPAVE